MKYVDKMIMRYKAIRNKRFLQNTYSKKYAFVGFGSHSVNNLYPVLDYLDVPLKYICCKSPDKVELIKKKTGIATTVLIDEILNDGEVEGVFVSVAPKSHFDIAKKVLECGKSLFIEKPPCCSIEELNVLINLAEMNKVAVTVVGMQKRYSPIAQILVNRLNSEKCLSYNMRYLTGLYPEGDALLDLFIHPLDYVSFIFGDADVVGSDYVKQSDGGITLMLLLSHKNAKGMLELSTRHTWSHAEEWLSINTKGGIYVQEQMEKLRFYPKNGTLLGVPIEKIIHRQHLEMELFGRNNFVPTFANNQIYTQGYFNEIKTFVDAVEGKEYKKCLSSLQSMRSTYELIRTIKSIL